MSSPRVILVGREGCHLCEEARAVIARVCAETGEEFAEWDLDERDDLPAAYAEQVPVTLVDGRVHAIWRVEEGALRAALG